MAHHEENYRNSANRHHHNERRRNHPHFHDERNFNDFGSRWGEPEPRFSPHPEDWREDEMYARDNRRRDPSADWRPFERQIREHHRHQRHEGERHDYREPVWRQSDIHFNSSNQHADDRWLNDEYMPHPQHEERHYREERGRRSYRRD
jgi:hypothetical protein